MAAEINWSSPGPATTGELTGSPFPIEPTVDGALYLAAEILWPEVWPAYHNAEIWLSENAWRNQADGLYE